MLVTLVDGGLLDIGVGFAFIAPSATHIAHRVRRSLRIANADAIANDARMYVPPVAVLVRGILLSLLPPFYRPQPCFACENLRGLGVRIRELEVRLRAHEPSASPLGLPV
jgi:hypothetical protein